MAITLIGTVETEELRGSHGDEDFLVSIPGSGQANDYIIIQVGCGNGVDFTLPSGWTALGPVSGAHGAFTRFIGILDTAGTLTNLNWTGYQATDTYDWLTYASRWRGVDPTTPLDAAVVTQLIASGTVHTCLAITTVTDGAAVIRLIGSDREEIGDVGTTHDPTQDDETHQVSNTGGGFEFSYAFGWKIKATAGDAGTVVWTTDGFEGSWSGTVALRPVAVAGGFAYSQGYIIG